jgi:hypothetical protein
MLKLEVLRLTNRNTQQTTTLGLAQRRRALCTAVSTICSATTPQDLLPPPPAQLLYCVPLEGIAAYRTVFSSIRPLQSLGLPDVLR